MLTIDTRQVAFTDSELTKELPECVTLYRTYDLDPMKWLKNRKRSYNDGSRNLTSAAAQSHSFAHSVWRKFKKFAHELLTNSPDQHVFWIPFALAKGIHIIRRHRIHVICCSSPPHSSLLVTFLLAKWFGIPYVIDLRDPWIVRDAGSSGLNKSRLMINIEAYLQDIILRNAARIITVSRGFRDELVKAYPEVSADRFVVITNGYDADDFKLLAPAVDEPSKFKIAHIGTIYLGAGDEFFKGVSFLLSLHPELQAVLELHLVGCVDERYQEMIVELGLEKVTRLHGFQPHRRAMQYAVDSDLLVILLGGERFPGWVLTGKLFEYLFIGKPILAVSKEGELSAMLARSGVGFVVPPNDVEGLAATLWNIYQAKRGQRLGVDSDREYVQGFERRALARQLALTLNEVVGSQLPAGSALGYE